MDAQMNSMASGSYESAVSTRMIATRCAKCGRALRDAESVQAGMGPDCRERHGYGVPDRAPDFAAAGMVLSGVAAIGPSDESWGRLEGLIERGCIVDSASEAQEVSRSMANTLTHWLALDRADKETDLSRARVAAIRALGFDRLADALAEALGEAGSGIVTVRHSGTNLIVTCSRLSKADFGAYRQACRTVPGARFDGDSRGWLVSSQYKGALWTAIRLALPLGTKVNGVEITAKSKVEAEADKARPAASHAAAQRMSAEQTYGAPRCPRCGGSGNYKHFGKCFACNGSGRAYRS